MVEWESQFIDTIPEFIAGLVSRGQADWLCYLCSQEMNRRHFGELLLVLFLVFYLSLLKYTRASELWGKLFEACLLR